MAKDTFIFRKEWKDAISGLPNEVRLEIYEAIIEYGTSGKLTDLKQLAKIAFNFAKVAIDKDAEKYAETISKRREAGKKGNEKRWGESQNVANATDAIQESQNVANVADNVSDNESLLMRDDKKPTNVGKKAADAATPTATLEARKEKFGQSLAPYVQNYGKELIRAFFDYWTEPNKSKTKMRFELERTWDTKRRLNTWASHDKNFNRNDNGAINRTNSEEERAKRYQGTADLLTRLAAEDDATTA